MSDGNPDGLRDGIQPDDSGTMADSCGCQSGSAALGVVILGFISKNYAKKLQKQVKNTAIRDGNNCDIIDK